jgi:hypothetical protein
VLVLFEVAVYFLLLLLLLRRCGSVLSWCFSVVVCWSWCCGLLGVLLLRVCGVCFVLSLVCVWLVFFCLWWFWCVLVGPLFWWLLFFLRCSVAPGVGWFMLLLVRVLLFWFFWW